MHLPVDEILPHVLAINHVFSKNDLLLDSIRHSEAEIFCDLFRKLYAVGFLARN